MTRFYFRSILLLASSVAFTAFVASAQRDRVSSPAKTFSEPMLLVPKALGNFKRPISSSNVEAQAYFNQGFQLMYAFDMENAARSFHEAENRDPNCAICFWGEAWAWGPYLNGAMDSETAGYALAAIQKAKQLAAEHASPVERALIEAMSVRYVVNFDPAKRRDQDVPYSEAMRKVYEQFPNDLDVSTLYAESLFLLEPRRGSRDISSPNIKKIADILEGVLKADSQHVGACHLYIHLTEATTEPGRAEACANTLGNSIPGASHINHMPSHTWNQLGRWGDSVRANLQAWHSDQMAAVGEGFAIYPAHNLHMLLFAASMDGQGAVAIQAAKDYFKLSDNNMYQVLTLIRFGRFDEVLEIKKRPKDDFESGVWYFGQGYAHLRGGDKSAARSDLKHLLETAGKSTGEFRGHHAKDLLGILGGILEGEMYRADGDLENASASFKRAVTFQDALVYDEPEPLPFAARDWLGAALLEAKRFSDAEQVYREDLKKHPHNGWSLIGLKSALDAQGKSSPEVDSDFEKSWSRSDTWIHASRF
jgi:tetratricopeptide (TPR) repeat protein